MSFLSTKQIIFRIVMVVMAAEILVMCLLSSLDPLFSYAESTISALLLLLLATPAIYYWIIKPFVSERTEAMAQANHLAHTDALTQLANRRLIVGQLEKLISEGNRHNDHSAVLLLDLDGFKKINDKFGHEAGDAVLMCVAKRLSILVRSEDTVGRFGGDEFVILIGRLGASPKAAHNKVRQIALKLIDLINQPIDFRGKKLQVGTSIGVRMLGQELVNTETVLRDADTAMFLTKKAGGNDVSIFEQEKNAQLF